MTAPKTGRHDERATHALGSLATAGRVQVKAWLGDGLHGWFLDPPLHDSSSFAPLERYFDSSYSLTSDVASDLARIYEEVPAQRRSVWRNALGDLIAECPADHVHAPIFDALLKLARSIAAYDVLPQIANRMGDNDFGAMETEETGSLFAAALDAALDLTAETPAAARCLRLFFDHPGFRRHHEYGRLMLEALCVADPDRWVEHIRLLTSAVLEVDGEATEEARESVDRSAEIEADRAALVAEIVDIVGMERISHNLSRLDVMGNDAWFYRHLVRDKGGPCAVIRDKQASILVRRDRPDKKYQLAPYRSRGRHGAPLRHRDPPLEIDEKTKAQLQAIFQKVQAGAGAGTSPATP